MHIKRVQDILKSVRLKWVMKAMWEVNSYYSYIPSFSEHLHLSFESCFITPNHFCDLSDFTLFGIRQMSSLHISPHQSLLETDITPYHDPCLCTVSDYFIYFKNLFSPILYRLCPTCFLLHIHSDSHS